MLAGEGFSLECSNRHKPLNEEYLQC
jgi:hypothetical protein